MFVDIQNGLRRVARKLADKGAGNGVWTQAVKNAVVNAVSTDAYISVSGINDTAKRNGEWLFDVTFSKYDYGCNETRTDWRLLGLELIVESEWGNDGDLLDDFEKLLVARSKRKLMIFQAKTEKAYLERKDLLASAMKAFTPATHDVIWLACFVEDNKWEPVFDDL